MITYLQKAYILFWLRDYLHILNNFVVLAISYYLSFSCYQVKVVYTQTNNHTSKKYVNQ